MIKIEHLSKAYNDNVVFKDFNLTIEENKFNILKGISGVGKTTLINCLLGLVDYEGNIKGVPTRISVVFQEDRLIDEISVYHNLRLVNQELTLEEANAYLKEFGLDGISKKEVSKLSGGMKRRVAILRALIFEANFYILDEPFKGLDSDTKNKVIKIIKEKLKNKTVLIVLHEKSEIEDFDGRLIDLNKMN